MEPITVALIASIVPACTLVLGWVSMRKKADQNDMDRRTASRDREYDLLKADLARIKIELANCHNDRDRYQRENVLLMERIIAIHEGQGR